MQKSTVIFMHLESGLFSAIRTHKVHENWENIGINGNSLRDISYWPPLSSVKQNRRKNVLSHFALSKIFVKKPILCKFLSVWSFVMLNSPCSFGPLSSSQKQVTCPWNYTKILGKVCNSLVSIALCFKQFKNLLYDMAFSCSIFNYALTIYYIFLVSDQAGARGTQVSDFQRLHKLERSNYFSWHDLLTALINYVTPLKC